jgi:hypothetical protein
MIYIQVFLKLNGKRLLVAPECFRIKMVMVGMDLMMPRAQMQH